MGLNKFQNKIWGLLSTFVIRTGFFVLKGFCHRGFVLGGFVLGGFVLEGVCPYTKSNTHCKFILQKTIVRIVYGANVIDHTDVSFQDLQFLKFGDLVK